MPATLPHTAHAAAVGSGGSSHTIDTPVVVGVVAGSGSRSEGPTRRQYDSHVGSVTRMASHITSCPSCGKKNRVPVARAGPPPLRVVPGRPAVARRRRRRDFAAAVGTVRAGGRRPVGAVVRSVQDDRTRARAAVARVRRSSQGGQGQRRRVTARPLAVTRRCSIPMLLVMRDGEVVDTVIGAQPEHVLRDLVQRHL